MVQTNKTPWGVFTGEMASITSRGTSTQRTSSGKGGRLSGSVQTTVSRLAFHRRASSSSLGLSHRNWLC